jgi:hypothetical protein
MNLKTGEAKMSRAIEKQENIAVCKDFLSSLQ